jgi:hypothetical protein
MSTGRQGHDGFVSFLGRSRTAMGFYRDVVYPALVRRLGNPKPIQALREQIVPMARGDVLEIGVGSGANFRYYDPARGTDGSVGAGRA